MMKGITSTPFGTTGRGEAVTAFTLTNASGAYATILNYGCTLQKLCVPGRDGALRDVVLGYDAIADYEKNGGYFGATVGRCANRIAGGRFSLDGNDYTLYLNDGDNHLHGGARGYDKYVWEHAVEGDKLIFTRISPDMEEGYPGTLRLRLAVSFDDANALTLDYSAQSDKKTVVNLTNHAYFNLEGHGSGGIENHTLTLHASGYTPAGPGLIPTGEIRPVAGTPFDFNTAKELGRDFGSEDPQVKATGGYDHNFALDGEGMRGIAVLSAPGSGVSMEVSTDLPGVQIYTANKLSTVAGKGGAVYGAHGGVCMETQFFPNAVNTPAFATSVLEAGVELHTVTVYRFFN